MWTAIAETTYGSYFRMESQRTFDAIVATPVSVDDVTSGEILWAATRGLMTTTYVLGLIAVFGAVGSPLAVLVFPLAAVTGVMFGAIALCYTAVNRSVSSLNYFFAIYVTPQFWLAGVFFPLSQLPDWVEKTAWFVPASHVVEVQRSLVAGEWHLSYLGHLAWIVVVTALFYPLALALMRRRLVK
jgi:lipooligosaccharide transport system permease protein